MTLSPPDEALHFRGKTLTPESPRPLHIPEPANIPVLENQMDPVFNDTSTYERSVYNQVPQKHDGWSHEGLKDSQGGPPQSQDAGSSHGLQPSAMQNEMTVSAPYHPSNPASVSENSGHLSSGSLLGSYNAHTVPIAPLPQGFATSSEVDHPPEQTEGKKEEGGVNFQNLLDNISRPNPGATIHAVSPAENSSLHQATVGEALQNQGLPAHPQAQHNHSIQAHYAPNREVAYHQPSSTNNTSANAFSSTQSSNPLPQNQFTIAPGATNPPLSNFPQTPSTGAESQTSLQESSAALKKARVEKQGRPVKVADDDAPWGPEVQKKYDEFLHDERIYVTEGLWDRFPMGSRLFVGQSFVHTLKQSNLTILAGNLPTERVTKRDMFHIFHKYGKLAQISIKQAYGFIQFLEASSCHEALGIEQGAIVRGRKIRK